MVVREKQVLDIADAYNQKRYRKSMNKPELQQISEQYNKKTDEQSDVLIKEAKTDNKIEAVCFSKSTKSIWYRFGSQIILYKVCN